MIQEGQGVTEHRWIGFIGFKITKKFIKYKTSDSVGTIDRVTMCRVGVKTIRGGSNFAF